MPSLRPLPLLLTLLLPTPGAGQTAPTLSERVLAAASVPALAQQARAAGVSHDELELLLDVLADGAVPGTEARTILTEETRAAADHGPVPGLGGFVRAKVAAGVRGQALADAIRAEHAARGRKDGVRPVTADEVLAEKRAARTQSLKPRKSKEAPR